VNENWEYSSYKYDYVVQKIRKLMSETRVSVEYSSYKYDYVVQKIRKLMSETRVWVYLP
jgi:hypothetical protein